MVLRGAILEVDAIGCDRSSSDEFAAAVLLRLSRAGIVVWTKPCTIITAPVASLLGIAGASSCAESSARSADVPGSDKEAPVAAEGSNWLESPGRASSRVASLLDGPTPSQPLNLLVKLRIDVLLARRSSLSVEGPVDDSVILAEAGGVTIEDSAAPEFWDDLSSLSSNSTVLGGRLILLDRRSRLSA